MGTKVNLANPVCFGLKWFVDLSWFSTTEEEILAVYEAAVLTNSEKTSKLARLCLQVRFWLSLFLDVR